MRMAHPLRCEAEPTKSFQRLREFFGGKCWKNLSTAFAGDGLTSELTTALIEDPENAPLHALLEMSTQLAGGTEVGNSYAALLYLRQMANPQPYFVVDDNLVEILENIDIADDVPVSMLTLPYQRFYVEFGKKRECSLMLPNTLSGLHTFEGAYVEQGLNEILGEGIFVLLTGSPLGKSDVMDDATHSLFIPTADPARSVKDALASTFSKGKEIAADMGYIPTPSSFEARSLECVMLLTKALLYIGLPEARRLVNPAKTDWLAGLRALKSPGKRAKAYKKGRGLVDHIVISAAENESTTGPAAGSTGRSVKSHWRRGHYRMQRHGPQLSLSKVVLLLPMLVHRESGEVPETPRYAVK